MAPSSTNIDRVPTLPALLAARGYVSHQSGKWWEGSFARGGFTHGMTRGFPQPGGRHGDDGLRIGRDGMQPVLEFIDGAIDQQRPFFVWYAPFLPHTPHNPPERLLDKYTARGVTPDRIARYYAMVEWFDETTGALLAHLETRGVAGRTLVVYIGDNGWIQRPDANDFAPRSKQSPNEGGVRQPTMSRWPGVVLGEGFAHDIADLDDPEASLLYRWVIQGRWKLLLTYDGTLGRYAKYHPLTERRPQLFDLLADPHEDVNLADRHAGVVTALADRLAAWWPVKSRAVQTIFPGAPGSGPRAPAVARSRRVYLIKGDDVTMLVDWVRVTRAA